MFGRIFLVFLVILCPLVAVAGDEEKGEAPFEREQWFLHQRLNKNGQVGARERLQALAKREHQQSVGDSAFPSQNWQLIGPQPENVENIPVSAGRVTSLVVDPRSATTVYAGTAEGGVWKTTNGGVNWMPLTDTQPSLAIGSLALDPSNPDTIYAGTGEGNFNADAYEGSGVLKSTDGGVTWTLLGQDYLTGGAIGSLAVSPSNSQILLAGVEGAGLAVSSDGGMTWTNPIQNYAATAVAFDPADGTQAWAGVCSIFLDQSNGLYHSTDGGTTWTIVSTAPLPQSGIGRIAIAFAPSNPKTIYVGMSGIIPNDSLFLGAFVSTDGGTTWTSNPAGYKGDWYRNAMAVSPTDPTFVVGGGLEAYYTQDGNMTWLQADPSGLLHVDQHAFAFSADGSVLYVGNDGGVFSTPTASMPFAWSSLDSTLAITQFYPGFSIHPTDTTVSIGGTQDNGTLMYSGSLKWTYSTCGDGGATYIVPQNPQNVFVTCQTGGLYFSSSGGAAGTFTINMTGVPKSEVPFVGVVAGDPSNQNGAWWGGVTNLWYAANQGTGWTKATASLAANSIETISAVSAVSTDGNTVIFGDLGGDVFCSTNAKSTAPTWTACGSTIIGGPISSIIADPTASGAAFLTETGYGNDHIFHTTNGGQTWTDLQGDLPDVPVSAVLLDQVAGFLYAATDVGVFMSANNGGHWQPLGTGLPNTVITGLQFYQSARLLRASSHGRSMWDITLPIEPPALGNNGIVNSASFAAAAPGSIAAAFGTALTDGVEVASTIPLPSSLAGATLTVNGVDAPVFFASPGQINVQIPWEAPVGSTTATLTIGAQSSTAAMSIAQYAPGIYTLNASGQGQGVIVNSVTNAWAAASGSIPGINAAPVTAGDFITIFCTGLGPVSNQPADGAPAPSSPLASTTQGVTVSIGGVTVPALFSGLVPGLVGFYQVNAGIPSGVTASNSVPVSLTIGGVTSNTVTIAVQ
jgi:uncharacterized protein (TIGR03437 family)